MGDCRGGHRGIVWTFWRLALAIKRRAFSLYGVTLRRAERPIAYWTAMLLQLAGGVLVTVFIARMMWFPMIARLFAK